MIGRFEVFSLSLSEILTSWNKIATDEMKRFDLKGAYVIYLITLFKHPEGLTAANLCELCNKDKAEVSRALSVMEKKGLILRDASVPRGYRANITLTETGKKATNSLRKRIKLAVEKGGEGLSEKQRDDFYSSLETICNNLRKISKEGL